MWNVFTVVRVPSIEFFAKEEEEEEAKRFIEQKKKERRWVASSVQEAARFRSPGGPVDQALLVLRVQAGQRAFPPLRGWGREGIGMVNK